MENTIPDELYFAISRLLNPGGTSRTVMPLQVAAGPLARVPVATAIKVKRSLPSTTGVAITLTWINPERDFDKVSKYNIHVITEDTVVPTVYSAPTKSPWQFTVPLARSQRVILKVQTVLWNGQVSDIEIAPTVSLNVTLAAGEDIDALIDAAIAAAIPGIVDDVVAEITPLLDMNYIPAVPVTSVLDFNVATDTASLLSTSTDGKLVGIGIRVLTTLTAGGGANTCNITITNGATTTIIPVYSGSTVLNPALLAVIAPTTSAGGITSGDSFFIPLGDAEFTGTTSVVVDTTGQAANTGSVQVTLLYATKL